MNGVRSVGAFLWDARLAPKKSLLLGTKSKPILIKPTNTKTPTQEMIKCIAELFIKMFTILARIIPIKPMIKKEPNLVKSLLVV